MPFAVGHPGVFLLPIAAFAVHTGHALAVEAVMAYATLVSGLYLHYVTNVINEICGHLGIECFRIKAKGARKISQ